MRASFPHTDIAFSFGEEGFRLLFLASANIQKQFTPSPDLAIRFSPTMPKAESLSC
jgi:hypothetical protein